MMAPPMTLEEWLDDLCARFIVNLPSSELQDARRIVFYIEEAHWFYEDWIREEDRTLPSLNQHAFSMSIFQHCPLTKNWPRELCERAYDVWLRYKQRVPVRGAILLNEAMDSIVLVKGWKGSSWGFPRGKINQEEDDLDCAIREVAEETGFDVNEAGLIPADRRKIKPIERTIREQHMKMFVIPSVSMDTYFEPRTRKEISGIKWFRLADLTGKKTNVPKLYMVQPFLDPLNKWVKHQRQRRDRARNNHKNGLLVQSEIEEVMTEEEGMATETGPEHLPAFRTVESHEAATRELHRLLKIQPPTHSSQGAVSDQVQDKGQLLLAMLQKKEDVSIRPVSTAQPSAHVPQTPLDHIYNVVPEPHTPQHHRPTERLPSDSQKAPPPFPVPPDMNYQLRSVLGISGNPTGQTMQQAQAVNQRWPMTMEPAHVNRADLVHPQPLPRQANHILASAMRPTPPVLDNRHNQIPQQPHVPGSFSVGKALPQQSAADTRQAPIMLDNTRLTLLNAFKKDDVPTKEPAPSSSSPQQPTTEGRRPSQQLPLNLASFASTYATQPSVLLPTQNGPRNMPIVSNGNSKQIASQSGLRPSTVSETQQKALLNLFKPSSALSPRRDAQADLKENQMNALERSYGLSPGLTAIPEAVQTNNGSIQANRGLSLPYGTQSNAIRPTNGDQSGPRQQPAPLLAQKLSGPGFDGARAGNTQQFVGSPLRVPQNTLISSPSYGHPIQAGLPNTSVNAARLPNVVPRHQETDPQQLQKLMSLFRGPMIPAPESSSTNAAVTGNAKEPALYDIMGHVPDPSSHAASLGASPGVDGAGGGASTSRRDSQQAALMSPENEKFLLNYLNETVSSSAK